MKIALYELDALVVVDMQKDFLPGGALPVKNADTIIPTINHYIDLFVAKELPIFFTRDWHPKDHVSFEKNGGIWPEHCVAGTQGAQFAGGLTIPKDNRLIISKGTSKDFDAYSGFQGTQLHALLQERGVKRLFVCGVAGDYCVKHTALGGLHLGYWVILLEDGIKSVNEAAKPLDSLLGLGAIIASKEALT